MAFKTGEIKCPGYKYMFTKLQQFARDNKIEITELQLKQLKDFCTALAEKNKVMNLTAIDSAEEIEIKHLLDSVTGAVVINEIVSRETISKQEAAGLSENLQSGVERVPKIAGYPESEEMNERLLQENQQSDCGDINSRGQKFSLIDVGCGAGFPGIPLKVLYPDAEFILLDSLNKRINFVNETAQLTGLQNIKGIAGRAEDLAKTEYREHFDICVSRAVANMNVLLEYCLPFVKPGGYAIMYKSGNCDEEVKNAEPVITLLGGELSEIRRFELPDGYGSRALVVIRKVDTTPEKYPRRAGKPAKQPLR